MKKKRQFIRSLREELKRGAYGVLHCHHDLVSAVYLLASAGLPVRRRIVHVHNADEGIPTISKFKRTLYREPMRLLCLASADRIVAISNHTLIKFLAGRAYRPRRDTVHYYGVDTTPFEEGVVDPLEFRRQLEFPEDALILLFGGRVVPEKNPVYSVDILAELRRLEPRAVLVVAGAGSLEGEVVARARKLGVDNAIRVLGWRTDLPNIMRCSDCFILPRPENPMEGFGLAVVEAQLAGLRMLISSGIADDALLGNATYRRLSPSLGPDVWARAAVDLLCQPAPSAKEAISQLAGSPMDMDRALQQLLELYE